MALLDNKETDKALRWLPDLGSVRGVFAIDRKVFQEMGCPADHCELAADVLINADLRGIDSHGIARLAGYVRLWEKNRINANPNIQVVHETPSTAVIDGDEGLGLVVAPKAMQLAMEKANTAGSGWGTAVQFASIPDLYSHPQIVIDDTPIRYSGVHVILNADGCSRMKQGSSVPLATSPKQIGPQIPM